jgi:hypothetical protein
LAPLRTRVQREAMNQLAAAATDQDALYRHTMKSRQLCAQCPVLRIGVLRYMGGLQRLHGHGTRPAGIAIGRKIMRRNAQRIGTAMHGCRIHIKHWQAAFLSTEQSKS